MTSQGNLQGNLQGNILLVDDTPDNLRFLSNLLGQQGYTVRTVLSGRMALTVVKTMPPELILLDICMPELDGYAVCQQLKANDGSRDIPVIFLSALDDLPDKIKAFEVGGVDYITKPFQAAEVLARVKTHLALQRLQRELQSANRELQRLVNIDGLTQVANRRHFDTYLAQEWHHRMHDRQPLSLILCDVDFFKAYNDTYGHLAGDDCLRSVASGLQQAIHRPGDLLARYGGEEFGIVLPDTSQEGVLSIAEDIHRQVKTLALPHTASSIASCITVSLGAATVVPTSQTLPDDLIGLADGALYQAKVEGRDRTVYFPAAPANSAPPLEV
ncbi:MAG: PleD family two-component system response regulator [Leptolyngbyaceae cyanobacterium bins.59]|nr:PleD family two-component system response regulator [Leptolyngbyaceae cyanobacterium bins.59]